MDDIYQRRKSGNSVKFAADFTATGATNDEQPSGPGGTAGAMRGSIIGGAGRGGGIGGVHSRRMSAPGHLSGVANNRKSTLQTVPERRQSFNPGGTITSAYKRKSVLTAVAEDKETNPSNFRENRKSLLKYNRPSISREPSKPFEYRPRQVRIGDDTQAFAARRSLTDDEGGGPIGSGGRRASATPRLSVLSARRPSFKPQMQRFSLPAYREAQSRRSTVKTYERGDGVDLKSLMRQNRSLSVGDQPRLGKGALGEFLPLKKWEVDKELYVQEPSTVPATRLDIETLQEDFDSKLRDQGARETGICQVRRAIYDQCFDEVIREVSINCAERGVLLTRQVTPSWPTMTNLTIHTSKPHCYKEDFDSKLRDQGAREPGICQVRRAIDDQCFDEVIREVSINCAERGVLLTRQEDFDSKLRDQGARETGICQVRRAIYDQCFDEVIREVSINCAERGVLLTSDNFYEEEEEVAGECRGFTREWLTASTHCGCDDAWAIVKRAGVCISQTGSGTGWANTSSMRYEERMSSTSSMMKSYSVASAFEGIGHPPSSERSISSAVNISTRFRALTGEGVKRFDSSLSASRLSGPDKAYLDSIYSPKL
ncbi:uncharacterized protein LOC142341319 [Convolutriloba macropyga]|uniref:uncharacterized protein LOC142341319 n=1 Tax=Convolutriloba macropyga TaxID=536237 RepID=UPI003F522F53